MLSVIVSVVSTETSPLHSSLIGPTPRTSSLLTQMGVVSAAVAIVATAGKLVGPGAAAKVAMVLMVVGACWWNAGLFNRSGNREFNLGLPSEQSPLKFLINDSHYLGKLLIIISAAPAPPGAAGAAGQQW